MLREYFTRLKRKAEHLNWGREIVVDFVGRYSPKKQSYSILDIGPGEGFDITNAKNVLSPASVRMYGVECYDEYISILESKGVSTSKINIERDRFPFEDGSIDIIIANQILEHTKEIFWITSEIARVLSPNGIAIIGVPNLASFHNRIMLLFGMQPSSIEIMGPHVRGFTKKSFEQFFTTGSYFSIKEVRGANFYPFPATLAKQLSSFFPSMSVGLFFCLQRTDKQGSFAEILQTRFFETNYFSG